MVTRRIIIFILSCMASMNFMSAKRPPTFEEKCASLNDGWSKVWRASDPRTISVTNNQDLISVKDNIAYNRRTRRLLLKEVDKGIADFRRNESAALQEKYRSQLIDAIQIEPYNADTILSAANLYLKILPDSAVSDIVPVYTDILLPIYMEEGNLTEIYYIYKLFCRYAESARKKPYHQNLLHIRDGLLSAYYNIKSDLTTEEKLQGMWVSQDRGKQNLPSYIVNIFDANDNFYAILSQYSSVSQRKKIKASLLSPMVFDSLNRGQMQFTYRRHDAGLSPMGVSFLSQMSSAVGETAIRAINIAPGISDIFRDPLSGTVELGLNVLIAVIAQSSVNENTDTYLDVYSHPYSGENTMVLDCEWITNNYRSDRGKAVRRDSVHNEVLLRRVYPDNEIIYVTKRAHPICYPSRLAFIHPEYYRVYDDYRKHFNRRKWVNSNPLLYYFYPVGIPVLCTQNGKAYNRRMFRKFIENHDID